MVTGLIFLSEIFPQPSFGFLCLIMSVKSVRGKICDINGFLHFSSSNAIFECIDRATDFILHNNLYEFLDCFSLERKIGGIFHYFYWHNCECNLPTIICMTSPSLKHKYITPNDRSQLYDKLDDFFNWAREYIWEHVLPKERKVKYPWIDFRKYHPFIFYPHASDTHSVDNEPDPQPPEKVISHSQVSRTPLRRYYLRQTLNGRKVKQVYHI